MTPQVLPVASAPPQAGRVRSDPEGGGNTAEPRGFQDTLALTISVEEQGKGTEKSPAGPRTAKEKDDASQTSQAPAALASLLLQMSAGGNVPRPLVAADGGPDAGSAGVQGITAQNVAGRLAGIQIMEALAAGTGPGGSQPEGTQPSLTQLAGIQLAGTELAGAQPSGPELAGTQPSLTQLAGTRLAGTQLAGPQNVESQTPAAVPPASGGAIAGIAVAVNTAMNELVALLKSSGGMFPSLNIKAGATRPAAGDEQPGTLSAPTEASAVPAKGDGTAVASRPALAPAAELRSQAMEYLKQQVAGIMEQPLQADTADPAMSAVPAFRETEPAAAVSVAEKASKIPAPPSRDDHGTQASGSGAAAGDLSAGSSEPARTSSRPADGPSQSPPSTPVPDSARKGDASPQDGTPPDASAPKHEKASAAQAPQASHAAGGPEQGDALGRVQAQSTLTSAAPAPRTTERPATSSATHTPLSLPPEASRDVVDQVIRGLSLTLVEGAQEVRMTLKPESLGDVFLQVRMEEGKMQAQIDVSQPAVKAALDGQIADLRLALQQRGIDVQRIDIIAGSPSAGDGGGNQTGRFRQKMSRHAVGPDDQEADPAARSLGYNTLELIM